MKNKKTFVLPDVVETSAGPVSGVSGRNPSVIVFRGIPYAAPPAGQFRWEAPRPVQTWTDVRSCTEFGPSAMQPQQEPFSVWTKEFIIDTAKKTAAYSENCLSLNIWTDSASSDGSRPVIVFIHGGAFIAGGSSCEIYDGERLAEKGIVFVSVNYRLGIFGFFSHPALSAESPAGTSGNYGLMDQIAALVWIKQNISAFGGDPANVTIHGQSAGAGCVECLMMSSLAKGLFCKAVTQSFDITGLKLKTKTEAENAGSKKITATGDSLADLTAKQLRAIPAADLVDDESYQPVLDGHVVAEDFKEQLEKKTYADIPLMSSMAAGDDSIFSTTKEELLADQYRLASVRSENGTQPTWLYFFTHVMPGKESRRCGAFHTSDVPYSFGYLSPLRAKWWTPADRALAEMMSSYLANFARTGDPNGDKLPVWNPFPTVLTAGPTPHQLTLLLTGKEKASWIKFF